MNENIDLTKILKDCPEGWEFYSSVYGEVEFMEILSIFSIQGIMQEQALYLAEKESRDYPIQFKAHDSIYRVTSTGELVKGIGECTFFPSREQRDWSKFTAPWLKKERFDPKTLHPFDKVLARSHDSHKWTCDLFSDIIDGSECIMYHCIVSYYKYCIPYNDDTKHLIDTTDEAPEYYRYWED